MLPAAAQWQLKKNRRHYISFNTVNEAVSSFAGQPHKAPVEKPACVRELGER